MLSDGLGRLRQRLAGIIDGGVGTVPARNRDVKLRIENVTVNIFANEDAVRKNICLMLNRKDEGWEVGEAIRAAMSHLAPEYREGDPNGDPVGGELAVALGVNNKKHNFFVNNKGDVFYYSTNPADNEKAESLGFKLGDIFAASRVLAVKGDEKGEIKE